MKNLDLKILTFICLLTWQIGFGQDQDNIATLRVQSFEHPYIPLLKFGSTVDISFDDLEADQKDYFYRITHRDVDWHPSNIQVSEYLSGYQSDRIRNFSNSQNTLQFFTHYQFSLPNENTQITRTGNYLIEIMDNANKVVASRRLTIYHPKLTVQSQVYRSRETGMRETKQSLQVDLYHPNLKITQPDKELSLVILQNGDWTTAKTNIQYSYIRNNQIEYRYGPQTSFWAGNEFLNFDTKYLRTSNNRVDKVELGEELYESYLFPDKNRNNGEYTYNPDINGAFKIRINNQENSSDLNADYTYVHFELKTEKTKSEIYLYGAFNNYQITEYNKMYYDKKSKSYKGEYLLKQGFYNYTYLTLDKENPNAVNGDYYQTENEYQTLVYFQKLGNRYYEVVGYNQTNSTQIKN